MITYAIADMSVAPHSRKPRVPGVSSRRNPVNLAGDVSRVIKTFFKALLRSASIKTCSSAITITAVDVGTGVSGCGEVACPGRPQER